MDTILEVFSFCHKNNCIPTAVLLGDKHMFKDLDSIVDNWFMGASLPHKETPMNEDEKFMIHQMYELLKDMSTTLLRISVVSYRVECKVLDIDLDTIFKELTFDMMIYNGMRKIASSLTGKVPEWFLEDTKYDMGSIYTRLEGMLLRIQKRCISFKYDKDIDLDMFLEVVTSNIRSEVLYIKRSKFISISEVQTRKPWKKTHNGRYHYK